MSSGLGDLKNKIFIIGGLIVGAANIYSNYLSIRDEHLKKENNSEELIQELNVKKNELEREIKNNKGKYEDKEIELVNKYLGNYYEFDMNRKFFKNLLIEKSSLYDKIEQEREKLQTGNLTDSEVKLTKSNIDVLKKMVTGKDLELTLLSEKMEKNKNDYSNNLKKDNITDSHDEVTNTVIKSPLDKLEISIYEFIRDIRDNWYDNLNKLQQLCVSLLILNGVIFACVVNICLSLFGEYLINRFSLETRFPKLSKLIILRKKFQRYYLKFNLLVIILVVLTEMLFSIAVISL
jgi:hypothetical protein